MTKMDEAMKETRQMMRQMMTSWSRTQQQMIDQWLGMVEDMSSAQSRQLWTQTLSVWESSVKRTMEAQNATMNSWMSQLQEIDDMPEEAQQHIEEGKAIMKRWSKMQSELWAKWFETMRQMDPGKYESNWQEMARHSVSVWRNYAEKIQALSEEALSDAPDAK